MLGRQGVGVAALAGALLAAASLTLVSRATSADTRVLPTRVPTAPTTSAPPPDLRTWVQTTHQLTYGGLPRSYLLIRPQARGRRLPVVVVLHGRNATPALEAARTGLPAVTGPAVLVYPAGYGQSWDAGACCGPAQAAGVDDVGFVAGVLRDVQAGNPDTSGAPVYVVGYSNGGKLAYRLACAEPSLFTAVAAVGAVAVSPCPSPAPIPFVEVASLGDPELAYGTAPPVRLNGYTELNVDAQVGQRAQANGCRSSASTTEGVLTITRWAGCLPGRAVELALYRGGSHSWPAGDASTPPAQVVVWRFFRSSLVST